MKSKISSETLTLLLIVVLVGGAMPFALAQEVSNEEKSVPRIYLAAKQGNLPLVRSLIAEGSDVNAANVSGRSALMSAVFFSNRGIVKELLIEGANVNSADSQGRTALMIAVTRQDMEMIDLLLAAGADVGIADKTSNTALTLAERTKNKKMLKRLEDVAG